MHSLYRKTLLSFIVILNLILRAHSEILYSFLYFINLFFYFIQILLKKDTCDITYALELQIEWGGGGSFLCVY